MGFGTFLGFQMGEDESEGSNVVLCNVSGWAPLFCRKVELKSEKCNSVLCPNRN